MGGGKAFLVKSQRTLRQIIKIVLLTYIFSVESFYSTLDREIFRILTSGSKDDRDDLDQGWIQSGEILMRGNLEDALLEALQVFFY